MSYVRRGMGDLIEYGNGPAGPIMMTPPPAKMVQSRARMPVAPRPRGRSLGSLGDDTLATGATDPTVAFQTALLASQQQLFQLAKTTSDTLTVQRWMQIAATLSIPLAGLVWKWILGRRGANL